VLNPKIQLHGYIGVFTYNLNEYAGDGRVSVRWNATEVYRRISEEWRIIHAHWSRRRKHTVASARPRLLWTWWDWDKLFYLNMNL